MATSGSKTFSLSISDTIEEAFELAGIELRTGHLRLCLQIGLTGVLIFGL